MDKFWYAKKNAALKKIENGYVLNFIKQKHCSASENFQYLLVLKASKYKETKFGIAEYLEEIILYFRNS